MPLAPLGTKALVYDDPATMPPGRHMQLMVSMLARLTTTTVVFASTSHQLGVFALRTCGGFTPPIDKSLLHLSKKKLTCSSQLIQTTWTIDPNYDQCQAQASHRNFPALQDYVQPA
jgi:hypothetical protein